MVQFVGTYKLETQENYKEYLISLGLDAEKASKLDALREDSVINAVDADSITALYGGSSIKYPLNKELEHTLIGGHKVWTTATINGNTVTFKSKLNAEGTLVDEKVLVFTDDGVTITSTNTKGAKCVRKYKRA